MTTQKDLSIIIVTFNSSEIIEKCLGNLSGKKYDIIVVDNDSKDNTTQIVENKFPQVKLIKNSNNIGYGRANNIALRQANSDFALILNPDALIAEEDIEISLKLLKNNNDIALATPKILNVEATAKQAQTQSTNNYTITNFVVGGVMFMQLAVFRKIGFFDEDFFMFAEDGELCDRAMQNGYKNAIIDGAAAFHFGGGSSKKSLRTTYRRFWHLGWSKSKYKRKRKGAIQTARATSRLVIIYFIESLFYLLTLDIDKSVSKFAFSAGCFSYLIGLKAFRKDGTARG